MVSTKRNFLVIVLFVDGDARRFEDRGVHFWFGWDHVQALREREYFLPNHADRRLRDLKCRSRMLPMLSVGEVLDSLVFQNHLN